MGSMGKASAGAGGFGHGGLFGPGGLSLFPLALLCLALGAGGYQQDEIGLNEFEGKAEAEEYDDYYEYVDLQKDSDGDGLRDHINDPDDDNDGIPDLEDDDDDGDGVNDREDLDWFAHDEM